MKLLLMLLILASVVVAEDDVLNNRLVFNVYKSPIGINWKNPKTLARTTAINNLLAGGSKFGHTLGHVSISLVCPSLGINVHTGMERVDLSESKKLVLKNGAGLGSLFHNFKGQIEDNNKVIQSIQYSLHKKKGRDLNFIQFLISDAACLRANDYYQEFKRSRTWLNYGMNNDPRKCEGSGCTAYGKSYLDIVGFDYSHLDVHWKGIVNVPLSVIGKHRTKTYKKNHEEYAEYENSENIVKISKLASPFSKRIKWAKEDEKHIKVLYYSPDMMYDWVEDVYRSKEHNVRKIRKDLKSKVVTFDIRDIPTPTEPLMLKKCEEVEETDIEKYGVNK